MKLIVKNSEPEEWKAFRETAGARYESKPYLRKALYGEQGGICAYCMQRLLNEYDKEQSSIELNGERMTNVVDHIKCRERNQVLELVYTNMVMSCCGKSKKIKGGKDNVLEHCDESKANKDISFSLFEPAFIKSLSYNKDGEIKSNNPSWNDELKDVLSLNNELLKSNRSAVLKATRNELVGKNWKASDIRKQLNNWQSKDNYNLFKPYCGVVISYLERTMRANNIKL